MKRNNGGPFELLWCMIMCAAVGVLFIVKVILK